MTLADWTKLTGILPTHPTTETGAVSAVAQPGKDFSEALAFGSLWHLGDHAVSPRIGAIVWRVPRR
jgi:hypothetical protein